MQTKSSIFSLVVLFVISTAFSYTAQVVPVSVLDGKMAFELPEGFVATEKEKVGAKYFNNISPSHVWERNDEVVTVGIHPRTTSSDQMHTFFDHQMSIFDKGKVAKEWFSKSYVTENGQEYFVAKFDYNHSPLYVTLVGTVIDNKAIIITFNKAVEQKEGFDATVDGIVKTFKLNAATKEVEIESTESN